MTTNFNILNKEGFLILTREGQGINLEKQVVIGSFTSLLLEADVVSQYYYKYSENENDETIVTIYSAVTGKTLKTINLELESFTMHPYEDYFVVTNLETGISTKYSFKDYEMTSETLVEDDFINNYDIEIENYGYEFNNNEVTIYKDDIYYDFQPRMNYDKSANMSNIFVLNNGNILYYGLTYVLSDEDYDVYYNNQKVRLSYELYEVKSKKRNPIELDFIVTDLFNNMLYKNASNKDIEVITKKVENIVGARRINRETKTMIDLEPITLFVNNDLDSIKVFENDLGPIRINEFDMSIGINGYYQLKNNALFVFDDSGKVKQHYFNVSSTNQILYDKYVVSPSDTVGEYAIYDMNTRELISERISLINIYGANNYISVDSNNNYRLFLRDGNYKQLHGVFSGVVDWFGELDLTIYVTKDESVNRYYYYNQNGDLLFSVNNNGNSLNVLYTYAEDNSYRMLVSVYDINEGEKIFVIKGEPSI